MATRLDNMSFTPEGFAADLRREYKDVYEGRPVLITGADGFMGSHLTDALALIGADVHAFVRATSSGAINNIGHLQGEITIHSGDLTDKHSVDTVIKRLQGTHERPIIFHLAAQAHVGESWERPYETVMANAVGTLNLLQSVVDHDLDIEKFDTAGTSEEYGNINSSMRDHHDFDESDGGVILHERSPLNPKSIYATAKVAADFLTMNYFDAYQVPGVVTRMFNNYGPRQNPRYLTGTVITQALEMEVVELGALEPLRDFCYCLDGVRGHLTVAGFGKAGDVYCYGQGENISVLDWASMIIDVGVAHGFWPRREIVTTPSRYRPGASDVLALRVGYDKLSRETGWRPRFSWDSGVYQTIRWYAEHRSRWIGRVDWRLQDARSHARASR